MVVGALIVKHVEGLSDEKTIQAIQENPYMQYCLGFPSSRRNPFSFQSCSSKFASVSIMNSSTC
ncbi:transposase [Hallella sp.]|uniref:transposase n=1 Tax=Hallella sp. TaxID=2980186 RepID=UPI003FA5514E